VDARLLGPVRGDAASIPHGLPHGEDEPTITRFCGMAQEHPEVRSWRQATTTVHPVFAAVSRAAQRLLR
jgi:hypothetical protein